ncbi:hypothetical protein IPV09_00120 [Tessaracoccus sp. SD287]|uniref:hypothetical protein n=1 Tax=Tessaracoccus sp. SD287 TaxID=2782008 RepID=UPI001A963E34|nr:hypothetical protein [Tessaracoccus sp. SD287]MBO1029741.1 hypothetical protein [Tessaracoccus sp. SD287]
MNRWGEFGVDAGITLVIGALLVLFGVRFVDRLLRFASNEPRSAADKLKGGAWIGALERLATYVSVIAHFLPGLAIILAVKGLARYPELRAKDPDVAERFIIGTFVSVLLAVGGAALTLWLTSLT